MQRPPLSALGLPLFRYLGGAFVNEMPLPLGNVIGGGAHAANATEIQEFLIVPGAQRMSKRQSLQMPPSTGTSRNS